MLIAMLAGSVISITSVACPPEFGPSEGDPIKAPQVGQFGQVVRLKTDDPAPGTMDCMGTPAPVKVSEAPFEQQFTDAMLNKMWVTCAAGASVREFTVAVGKAAEREVWVDWERLDAAGIKPEAKIAAPLAHVYIEQAFRLVNERMAASGAGGRIAARRMGDLIEVSTQEAFDRREKKTVAFDLRPLLAGLEAGAADAKAKEILGALTSTIEPEGWTDNGGDTARSSMAEGRLFVVAPPRVQKAVAWFFGQVSDQPLAGAEVLRAGEPVQTLQIEPVQIDSRDEQRKELGEMIKSIRRELAWRKVMLGAPLTAEDRAAMDDARSVHAVGPSGPSREQIEKEANDLGSKLKMVRAQLAKLGGAGE